MEASADNRFLAVGAGMPEVIILASDLSRIRPSQRKLRKTLAKKTGAAACRPVVPRDTRASRQM